MTAALAGAGYLAVWKKANYHRQELVVSNILPRPIKSQVFCGGLPKVNQKGFAI
ncbi:hypothetical protein ACJJIK_14380 [Microbulbifer sp. ZKSA006]|uniref:hypothetical protein n=1 Tax=Microbulbifer sp. ZKSA006 TaxID=3243390 RepID=UPI0040399613